MPPRIGLGVSEFRELRSRQLAYIDKSLLLEELVQDEAKAILLTRPRRFGKTLNLSMMRTFFERGTPEDAAARWGLFADLAIASASPEVRGHFARYPVIALSLKGVKTDRWDECREALALVIADAYQEHRELLKAADLAAEDRAAFERILAQRASVVELWNSLRLLTRLLHRAHGQPVLLMIDEYDTPLQSAYVHGYYEDAVKFMRNLLSEGLKDNPHLWKGVLTGILRVARDSIFSGLNHLAVYTVLATEYASSFGFSEEEVRTLLPTGSEGEAQLAVVRDWYNGYLFGNRVVYNPWSVLSFVKSAQKEPQPYWIMTGGTDLIRELLIDQGHGLSAEMELLLRGEAIDKKLADQIVLRDAAGREDVVWSLLLHSGYLKPLRLTRVDGLPIATLAIPNREVQSIYRELLLNWVDGGVGGERNRRALCAAVLAGDAETVERHVQTWLMASASFHDTARPPEKFYHGFVLGLLVDLSQTHDVRSNRESGAGRCDVLVLPRRPGLPGVALELKVRDTRRRQSVESALRAAHTQLRERDYAAALRQAGATPVRQLALVFDGKTVHVTAA